jgi:hypothetical protein
MKYFLRTVEKIPELEISVGIGALFLCPSGNAKLRNNSS